MKITSIKRFEKDKEGNPLKGKYGPYVRLLIQVEDPKWGGRDISFFENPNSPSKEWKVGDEVEIDVKENGQYLNGSYANKKFADGDLLRILDKRTYETFQSVLEIKRILFDVSKKLSIEVDYPAYDKEPEF